LTALEATIMDGLWELGEGSVRQVQESLQARRPLAYNTVLTMMRILRDKGFLASRREGRIDVYRPLVSRRQMGRRSLRELLARFFAGSPAALVSELLAAENLGPDDVSSIRREVNAHLRTLERNGDNHDALRGESE